MPLGINRPLPTFLWSSFVPHFPISTSASTNKYVFILIRQLAEVASLPRRKRRHHDGAVRARPVFPTRAGSTSHRPRWWRGSSRPTTGNPRHRSLKTYEMRNALVLTRTRCLCSSRYALNCLPSIARLLLGNAKEHWR